MAPGRSQLQPTEKGWATTVCCSASSSCLQLYWARFLVRKWFNISATESDHTPDTDDTDDDDSVADSDIEGIEEAHVDNDDAEPRLRRRNSETFRGQYMDTKAISLQEIVPLNAGNIFGIEDDRPASEWEDTIRDALNRIRPRKVKIVSYSDPPSPSKFKPFEEVTDVVDDMVFESSGDTCNVIHENFSFDDGIVDTNYDKRSCLPRQEYLQRQFSSPKTLDRLFSMQLDNGSTRAKSLSRWFSYSERVGLSWPEPPLRLLNQHVRERRCSLKPFKNYSSFKATGNKNGENKTPLLSDLDLKPLMNVRKPSYVRIVSKQMVGVFLTIWVRRSLRKHIRNLSVSTVGVGVMGYIGNKGSVSVSMSVYQTPFCFVCTHLASGEKDGDHRKRNADVSDIHRRTQFHPHSLSATRLPRSIRDHERIIWLGDLNYRINLSYEKTHELIARKDWKKLAEKDQLTREMRQGRVFEGWSEGTLDFPPTYKYEFDSENYGGNDPKSGKRTPAWCDRIIWYGKGMKLMSYRRSEIKLSDHRPVTATFVVEVEVFSPRKLQRTLTLTNAEIDSHEAFVHD
ncbi:PREDICTED: type I inositol polyphosphate 5-phosphatase 1-like isoform X2 [Camelina sativa]|uniref:Type I inositol polyphosphate 5-phosphatase 1-like isoform X2 n=1 Tax=Camelina sativa TaxID=90675 RepID=A0ABM0U9W7_CAMSA|nr:PREDICTED: type I inositol polyphosphate 5-phosphatase 1-like isoform X2 [Camelina sativa]